MIQSPLRGSYSFHNVTQGSQSLALGLALVAAPQLVELTSILLPSKSFSGRPTARPPGGNPALNNLNI